MEKHILFITSNRLGDAVLSTGLLNHILTTMPGARVTIACGHLPKTIFEGYPALAEIIPFRKEKYNLHWVRLWRQLAGRRWDMVIDLRNSAVSRLISARQRFIYGPHINQDLHKVEQAARTMRLEGIPDPALWFTAAQKRAAGSFIPEGTAVLGIGPTANWAGKIWPAERFIGVIETLTAMDGILPDARVAVFAAPGEEAQARPVFESIPSDRRIDMIARADPGTAAAALARCSLYIGHDSGLMHCAAAAGVPTVGLFGPSWPHLYGPWGKHTAYIRTPENFDELIAFDGYDPKTVGSLMITLDESVVEERILDFWSERESRD